MKAPILFSMFKRFNRQVREAAVEQGGLKVTTTLDINLQDKAQGIVSEEIAKVEKQHYKRGGCCHCPATGEILAWSDPKFQ